MLGRPLAICISLLGSGFAESETVIVRSQQSALRGREGDPVDTTSDFVEWTRGTRWFGATCFPKSGRKVCIDAFGMDRHDVSVGEYRKAMGVVPRFAGKCGDSCMVKAATPKEVKEYCEGIGKQAPTGTQLDFLRWNGFLPKVGKGPLGFRCGTDRPYAALEPASLPGGCFRMGNRNGRSPEASEHEVCLDPFRMDRTEVTQGAYFVVTGKKPAANLDCGDHCPVERVSWSEAQSFCGQLGKRLPTEAQWEYAALAGAATKWHWGEAVDSLSLFAWHQDNSGGATHPVGQKRPNAFGLYDMVGNVWEWTADRYGRDFYTSSPRTNPVGPGSGMARSRRGGGIQDAGIGMASAARYPVDPDLKNQFLGFRCVDSEMR